MSDIEEPPSKLLKLEMSDTGVEEHLEPEGDEDNMDDGQEEWLSEGVLTDDDYNAGGDQDTMGAAEMLDESHTADEDAAPSADSSTDRVERLNPADTPDWLEHSSNAQHGIKDDTSSQSTVEQAAKVNGTQEVPVPDSVKVGQDIEDTLNDLDSRSELPDDLDAFLIRKSDGQLLDKKARPEEQPAPVEDDGNDTDDLLRMLGEDDSKSKKKVLVKKGGSGGKSELLSSDDEFTYENAKVKTLKVAKSVLMKKRPATKAVPEVMSDDSTDTMSVDGQLNQLMSSDEATTMKNMFAVTSKKAVAAKSTAKGTLTQTKPQEKLAQINSGSVGKPAQPTPLKTYVNRSLQAKPPPPKPDAATMKKYFGPKSRPDASQRAEGQPPPRDRTAPHHEDEDDHDEIIDEEEFLEEEEDFELDEEDFGEESEPEKVGKQRIMRPERMDEEPPSDADTHSEDGSLYDEMPSSDSSELDEWFTLDVRAERAGDYLPLLGSKARSLLLEEKRRVSARLGTLRQSLSALTDSGRRQAEQLRRATMTLAELDDMLKAT